MLRLTQICVLGLVATAGCSGSEFTEDEARAECQVRFDEAEQGVVGCPERVDYLDDCERCFLDCEECAVEMNTCPPIITCE